MFNQDMVKVDMLEMWNYFCNKLPHDMLLNNTAIT